MNFSTRRYPFLLTFLFLTLPTLALSNDSISHSENEEETSIFSGFSGGMMLHVGYAFASSPDALFRNASITDVQNLPKDGVTMGIGGAMRFHFFKHLRIGAEGFVSTMPLMKSGSNVRTGWGGALVDCYWKGKKVTPFVGGSLGGGSTRRLYVPGDGTSVQSGDSIVYNASYSKTPFFYLDPYVGLEFKLTRRMNLITRIDWLLPFGKGEQGVGSERVKETIRWSNFITPSGPRLYIGFMFIH